MIAAGGCKRKSGAKTNPRMPISENPAQEQVEDEAETLRQTAEQEQAEALRLLGSPDDPEPDQGAASAPKGPSQEELQAEQERKERELAATEKAVSAAIAGVQESVRTCLSKANTATGTATAQIKVHRAGYVLDSSISGVDGECGACLQRVLKQIKVEGMQTDTQTFTRRFGFRNR